MVVRYSGYDPAEVCCICGDRVLWQDGTIAASYVDGSPAIVHEKHRADYSMWIIWWLAFSGASVSSASRRGSALAGGQR